MKKGVLVLMTVRLNIALDYDGTFTEDPEMFSSFIELSQKRGHTIYIVTLRSKEHDFEAIHDYLTNEYGIQIVWCDGRSKREVTEELGIKIDIWIDDNPECITKGSILSLEQLMAWREARK